ncbi:hypothetical protein GCM10028827_33620 [Mucilaginibacter myungsuensis]
MQRICRFPNPNFKPAKLLKMCGISGIKNAPDHTLTYTGTNGLYCVHQKRPDEHQFLGGINIALKVFKVGTKGC